MSDIHLLTLSPYITLTATAVAVMVISTFTRKRVVSTGLTGAGLAAAFACVLAAAGSPDRRATSLLLLDDFALYFTGLVVIVALAVLGVSVEYLQRTERRHSDFHVLLTLATLGAVVVLASAHFAAFFLGLELLSVSLYGLIAYPEGRTRALEAGFKYLVLASSTSAFLLFGMALVYAVSGDMSLQGLLAGSAGSSGWETAAYAVGSVLIFVGVGFKLAFVPFHLWAPDVYQGAPAPVTAFLASVSKVAVFVVLVRLVAPLGTSAGVLSVVFTVVAYASMLLGNLLALLQENLKRMLAYSSIAHVGYLAVALVAGASEGAAAVGFYLPVYAVALVAAFGAVGVLSYSGTRAGGEAESVEEYRGLAHRRPVLAVALTVSMMSLAGLPLTAGFIGKFLIFRAGAGASLWGLVVVLALTSAMSIYYYLQVVMIMFRTPAVAVEADGESAGHASSDRIATVTVALLSLVTVVLGIYPAPLLDLVERVAASIG